MSRSTRSAWMDAGLAATLIYMVVLGGTSAGDVDPTLRILNGLIAAALIVAYVARAPGRFDDVDVATLVAVLLFIGAGVLSMFRRQSFDAVMAALAFAAALHLTREVLNRPAPRRLFLLVFVGLSASFTLLLTGKWLMPVLEWWSRAGWTVIPPLNFELGASPWGHRHDLALLVVMLYPAWWLGRPSVVRRATALAVLFLDIGIVLVDGSRAVWLGVAVATAAMALPPGIRWAREQRHSRSTITGLLGIAVLIFLLAYATGIGGSLAQRALNFATLDYRTAMWGAIIGDWGNHPLGGTGPGSFPWLLQLTPYFDSNSWAPRHPDSAVMQSIAEGGLMGLGAIVVLVAAIGRRMVRGGSRAATWALIAFATTGLLASPTDFAFVIVVAIAWVGYALPRRSSSEPEPGHVRLRPATVTSFACLAIIGLAYAMTAVAMVSYERARVALAIDPRSAVEPAMDLAIGLDPGMAIYRRERGVFRLQHASPGAVRDLEIAVRLNPADDLARRSLAIAKLREEDLAGADSATAAAVKLQRSDPTNLLLEARFEALQGRAGASEQLVTEIVQAWPTIVFAPGWESVAEGGLTTAEAVDGALQRWSIGAVAPEPPADQAIWLTVLGGQDARKVGMAVAESGLGEMLGGAFARAMACEPPTVPFVRMGEGERRSYLYWWLRARQNGTPEEPEPAAARMAELMGRPLPTEVDSRGLNPLNENGVFSADQWGYRRTSIEWADAPSGLVLPSPSDGLAQWLLNPEAAVRMAGLGDELPACLAGAT